MGEENIAEEFRLKNLDERRNYLFEEIEQNELVSRKHRKFCATLNYIEHFLAPAVIGCVSITAFTSLAGILRDIASFAVA